ncbi:DUF2163 domain-containing protein [Polymorphum gilvum]|uniref:Putative phage cell wall peptidase, NlpC/P60 family n=1 Tax=Polymorphum gilvum (strain LMG 25793 / CGMCC 1.9160 / SL003B-26A1) TaxID=991905 RepID=F2J6H0_POLGS|nr:DUF2163 domain-containing protein [Polymorphum gilvum]ADZ71344.1 Putative phage cell wall peptidase, NlpC/P60 family [Polymorphum gilvum SL003B-26A1]
MKHIPEALAGHLAGRVTTLAVCWLVRRADGLVLGFTDHDRPLTVAGTPCRPENGLEATAVAQGPGLAAAGGEVAGSLSGPGLTDADLDAGLWDGAEVEVHVVNWAVPDETAMLRRAVIGEVTREGRAFRAELRGLAHLLGARRGRVFAQGCDADLGDARCTVDLDDPAYSATGTLSGPAQAADLIVDGLDGFADGWFSGGRLEVLSGPASGLAVAIARHDGTAEGARLRLWLAAPVSLDPGTQVRVTAGCDKRFATCAQKFANAVNFQGFPHMPGTDFVLSYPGRNTGENDGGALVP